MTADTLDPLIHVPARLQIMATLAALPDGDALSFTRLQDMIGLTPGNLITHLRKLEDAGYLDQREDRERAGIADLGRAHAPGSRRSGHLHQDAARHAQRAIAVTFTARRGSWE